ncbi:MAG: ankyrin repeat domain-containing protein [Verrucomicrobiota bacterium]|nr:ankyrin repeat domain-containing protein [Verrucomicrobiota bacterium]
MRGYLQKFIILTSVLLAIPSTHAQEETNDIWEAAATGDIDRLDELLGKDPKVVYATDTSGSTPLHHAAWTGQIETIKWLISNNANIDSQNNLQWTPLHWATRNGQTQSVKLLLDHNAKVDTPGNLNQTSLHLAAKHNLEKIVTILLTAKANPNKPDIFGQTPIHFAALENYTPILINLLENGGKIEVETIWGATPLSAAAARGRTTAVAALLIRNANVNHRTNLGWTPLFASVVGKYDSTTTLLRENGADINVVTKPGNTLLHAAASSGMNDIITELLDMNFVINTEDTGGRTPLDYAKDNLWNKTILLLKSKGGKTGSKSTLHHAAFSGEIRMLENLITEGADVSQRDDWYLPPRNWTPLHYAAAGGNLDVINRLIHLGADIRTLDYLGRTPMMIAIANGQTKAANLIKRWESLPKITKILYNGQIRFEVVGNADTEWGIEASIDLKKWTRIGTVKLDNGTGNFYDLRKILLPKCFYRAKKID